MVNVPIRRKGRKGGRERKGNEKKRKGKKRKKKRNCLLRVTI